MSATFNPLEFNSTGTAIGVGVSPLDTQNGLVIGQWVDGPIYDRPDTYNATYDPVIKGSFINAVSGTYEHTLQLVFLSGSEYSSTALNMYVKYNSADTTSYSKFVDTSTGCTSDVSYAESTNGYIHNTTTELIYKGRMFPATECNGFVHNGLNCIYNTQNNGTYWYMYNLSFTISRTYDVAQIGGAYLNIHYRVSYTDATLVGTTSSGQPYVSYTTESRSSSGLGEGWWSSSTQSMPPYSGSIQRVRAKFWWKYAGTWYCEPVEYYISTNYIYFLSSTSPGYLAFGLLDTDSDYTDGYFDITMKTNNTMLSNTVYNDEVN